MKADRELLELAAKAIGLTLRYNYLGGRDANQPWDPLEDDGDALRLAVKLDIGTDSNLSKVWAFSCTRDICATEEKNKDAAAATRRAIVRAAAAIGESMRD